MKKTIFTIEKNGLQAIECGEHIRFDNLTILKDLGKGANGQVFKAIDNLNRTIALKIWFRSGALRRRLEKAEFETKKLSIASGAQMIANVFAFGSISGFPYAKMEYIEGVTLKEWLRQETQYSFDTHYIIWRMLVSTLLPLYEKNILHGDIHAGNIMVVNDDRGIYRNIRDGLLSNAGIADKTTVPIGLKIDYKIDGVDYISPQSIGIKVLDFGTSEFWEDHSDFRDREISVLIETFQRIFTHEHGLEILQMNDLESPLLILHALRGLSDVYFLAHMFQQYGAEPGGSGHFPNVSVMNNDQLGILRRFASLIWRYPIFDIDKSIDFFIEVCGIDHKDSLRSEVGFCVAFNDFFGLELENIDLNLWFDGGWDRTCLLYAARRKQYIEQNDPYS